MLVTKKMLSNILASVCSRLVIEITNPCAYKRMQSGVSNLAVENFYN